MATGCISTTQIPNIKGLSDYVGNTFHTGDWLHEEVDFSGQSIAVIGTGSSGIQSIPVLAKQAKKLTVFQRTSNYSIPSQNEPMTKNTSVLGKMFTPNEEGDDILLMEA